MSKLARLDQQFVWHPFTQMRDWLRQKPIVIVSGKGAVLRDAKGRDYLDANSSIWTNLHGHNQPQINAAITRQLRKVAHSSALGLANEPASLLAARLLKGASLSGSARGAKLAKVFFSDDGSTAVEVALKLAHEFARRTRGTSRPRFLSMQGAYHGDTVGAASLGQIKLFNQSTAGLRFKTDSVMAPYCYRCPFNRAQPERADARHYRQCNWECVGKVEAKFAARKKQGSPYAAFVVEPLMQGAAGMIPQPQGWLRRVAQIARAHGTPLIADEVMTAFGRATDASAPRANLLACHAEEVQPDFACLAKGLTGGYLPMAATLTTQAVFDAFLGDYAQFKTFFHGHSYTGNQMGAAAALASLDILDEPASAKSRQRLQSAFAAALETLWVLPNVGDVRRVGLAAGIELVKDWRTREPYPLAARAGIRICEAMARRGVLTRPIGNVVVLMPPYCTTPVQVRKMVSALAEAVEEILGRAR